MRRRAGIAFLRKVEHAVTPNKTQSYRRHATFGPCHGESSYCRCWCRCSLTSTLLTINRYVLPHLLSRRLINACRLMQTPLCFARGLPLETAVSTILRTTKVAHRRDKDVVSLGGRGRYRPADSTNERKSSRRHVTIEEFIFYDPYMHLAVSFTVLNTFSVPMTRIQN